MRKVNVRIISATNKDLENEIEQGTFRRDLYFRLRVIELKIPALRERTADILPLAHIFLQQAKEEMMLQVTGFTSGAAELLLQYNWPGNIRELQNAVYRAAALCETDKIADVDLPAELQSSLNKPSGQNGIMRLEDLEKQHITYVLRAADGDKKTAARQLGIGVATLYRKIKTYGIGS